MSRLTLSNNRLLIYKRMYIQIPVEESNLLAAFTPKPPEKLALVDVQSKLKVIRLLTAENERRLDKFFKTLTQEFSLVTIVADVDGYRKIQVKHSRKTEKSILLKSCRPSIRAKNPYFSIEHVRDTFRFKAVVYSFRDALSFVFCMDKDTNLCPVGLCGQDSSQRKKNVAKLDIEKLLTPKEWGWRFLAFDFIMPNHQIVEVSVVLLNPLLYITEFLFFSSTVLHCFHRDGGHQKTTAFQCCCQPHLELPRDLREVAHCSHNQVERIKASRI